MEQKRLATLLAATLAISAFTANIEARGLKEEKCKGKPEELRACMENMSKYLNYLGGSVAALRKKLAEIRTSRADAQQVSAKLNELEGTFARLSRVYTQERVQMSTDPSLPKQVRADIFALPSEFPRTDQGQASMGAAYYNMDMVLQ